jgi:hypothetical protein
MLIGRFEAADSRLATVMTLASSLTLGAPVFAKTIRPQIQFGSPWFISAVVVFVIATVVGIFGRIRGTLTLPDPSVYFERWLHKSEWEFMKDAVYFAGEHFAANAEVVHQKSRTSLIVVGLLAVEILLLVSWVARSPA